MITVASSLSCTNHPCLVKMMCPLPYGIVATEKTQPRMLPLRPRHLLLVNVALLWDHQRMKIPKELLLLIGLLTWNKLLPLMPPKIPLLGGKYDDGLADRHGMI